MAISSGPLLMQKLEEFNVGSLVDVIKISSLRAHTSDEIIRGDGGAKEEKKRVR